MVAITDNSHLDGELAFGLLPPATMVSTINYSMAMDVGIDNRQVDRFPTCTTDVGPITIGLSISDRYSMDIGFGHFGL